MIADVKPSPAAVQLCVEQYGSVAHLARAIGVTPDQLLAWMHGAEAVPLAKYQEMLDAIASTKRR